MPSSTPRRGHTLVWTIPALGDLLEIAEYIRRDNPPAARRFAENLRAQVSRLARFPHAGRSVPEFPLAGLREVIVGEYRVIYRVVASARSVQILTVRHGARRLEITPPSR